jgi:hypothetical protein
LYQDILKNKNKIECLKWKYILRYGTIQSNNRKGISISEVKLCIATALKAMIPYELNKEATETYSVSQKKHFLPLGYY